jgi:PilZ domain
MSAPQSALTRNERINRRLHERVPINCQVRLCWQDRQGNHVLRARAMDLSHFGMLVETERAIEPGTVVAVETNSVTLGNACVRYCTPNGLKYRIGMHVPDHRRALLNSTKACAAGGGG